MVAQTISRVRFLAPPLELITPLFGNAGKDIARLFWREVCLRGKPEMAQRTSGETTTDGYKGCAARCQNLDEGQKTTGRLRLE
jgi:hypothetical protein